MRKFVAGGVFALIALCLFAAIGVVHPANYMELAPWGDFFGGVANPILTFLTFLAVLVTVFLQQEELNLSRKELARSASALEAQIESMTTQKNENTFFQLLTLHNKIVDNIDLTSSNKPTSKGRDCFSVFYNRLVNIYGGADSTFSIVETRRIEIAYDSFWISHQHELGHYFRILFRLCLFTERNFAHDDFYMNLVRAQLSEQEMLVLFYNSLSPQGTAFKAIAERWALFDNLPIARLLNINHKDLFKSSAYESNLAREVRMVESAAT